MLKALASYPQGVLYFDAREEQKLLVKVAGNKALLRAFVGHHERFVEEHISNVSDGLSVSRMLLKIGLACNVWSVLIDAPLWFKYFNDHWIIRYIKNRIFK